MTQELKSTRITKRSTRISVFPYPFITFSPVVSPLCYIYESSTIITFSPAVSPHCYDYKISTTITYFFHPFTSSTNFMISAFFSSSKARSPLVSMLKRISGSVLDGRRLKRQFSNSSPTPSVSSTRVAFSA